MKSKKFSKALMLGFVVFMSSFSFVYAQTEGVADTLFSKFGIEASADLNYSSIYMWRGIMLDGDPVLQPGFYLKSPESKLGRIKVGVWMSHDLKNRDNLKSSETDMIFDYTYNFKYVDASFGHTYYDFPDALPSDGAPKGWSREFYWGFTFPKLFLTPSIYYYYDYGKKEDGGGQGNYTVLNFAYSKPFTVKNIGMSFDLSGHVGHNNKLFYRGKGGDLGATAGVTVPLTKNLSCKPNVSYSLPWGNVSDKGNGNQKSRIYTGVYLNYVF